MRLVHAANPLRSLEQLADETGIPMSMILTLATHLQQWNKVRIIHPLTEDSVLCVRPQAPHEAPAPFAALWGPSSEPSYLELLHLFTSGRRFGAVLRAAEAINLPKRRLVQMAITLLQCDVLRPLLTYVHCVRDPPEPPEVRSSPRRGVGGGSAPVGISDGDGEEEERAPSPAMARWILFKRLRPMLHGEHHVEEILWEERLTRNVLDDLIQAYSPYLVAIATNEVDVGRLGARGYQTTGQVLS